jgi:predicted secreted protein
MKSRLFLFTVIIFVISVVSAISSAQRKPDAEQPIRGDFKITIKTNVAGQDMQSTTMIRGLRERSETSMGGMNMGMVSVTQCDLKRTIQINDRARKYTITPMDLDDPASGPSSGGGMGSTGGGTARRGGVVTMTVNTTDTGERKQIFGFNARHLKRTMISESSADACQAQQMKMETDGWYINLEYGLSCGSARPPQMGGRPAPQGCRDRYQFKHTGPANLGYPLIETMTMYGSDGSVQFTMTKEVIELSRQTLDAALFDVPAGYSEARSQQEMYSQPSMAEMQEMGRQRESQSSSRENSTPNATAPANAAARVKIGVVEFNNKAKATVSTDSLREQLIGMLNGNGLDAVALNASSPSEAAIEAKAKGCSYILYTDISTLKTASAGKKIGGLLGRATGVSSGDTGKSEAKFDFRLVPTGSSSPTVQSSASSKEDNQEASITAALQGEARALAAAVPRN